jgi:hypothetical protein
MKRIEPETALRVKAHVEAIKARVVNIQRRIYDKAGLIRTEVRSIVVGHERKDKSQ